MGKDWDYSELAHNAKEHGDPEQYLDFIRETGFNEGKLEGKSEGKTELLIAEGVALGIGLLGYAGYKAFSAIRDKREQEAINKQKQEAKRVEKELIDGMNKALKDEEKETSEPD
ncbi:MAG: hypothetical protein K6D38_06370 [Pseudobutyrivibrio sp.]|nr:hypothetical protein [Pseudobutyrivibrio sp.]